MANTGDDDAGHVGQRLRHHGYELHTRYRDQDGGPLDSNDYDLVVLLGSDWSVYWDKVAPFVAREAELVVDAATSNTPLLGICYGGQLMSHALGGSVERSDQVEIGWFEVASASELSPAGLWFEFHVDKFTPPPKAEVLATTSAGPQAYRLGRMLAVQYHPEVTPDIIRRWGAESGDEATKYGLDFEAMYRRSDELDSANRQRCYDLVDRFLDQVASAPYAAR